jgi:hypothetical protein
MDEGEPQCVGCGVGCGAIVGRHLRCNCFQARRIRVYGAFPQVVGPAPTTALTWARLLLYCARSLWKCTAVPKVLERRFAIQD